MWNRIYFIALTISVLVMMTLGYYSYSWLQSPTRPADVIENYNYFSNLAWMFLWISSLVLLVLANALYWRIEQAWALWATFVYFAVFVIVQTFVLDNAFADYQTRLLPGARSSFSAQPFLGAVLCVLAAIIVFFDQFLVRRLHKKMFGVAPEEIALKDEESL